MTYEEALEAAHKKFGGPENTSGKCYTYSMFIKNLVPELTMVCGDYITQDGFHNGHWWLEDKEGKIYDPTENQFNCPGRGTYKKH